MNSEKSFACHYILFLGLTVLGTYFPRSSQAQDVADQISDLRHLQESSVKGFVTEDDEQKIENLRRFIASGGQIDYTVLNSTFPLGGQTLLETNAQHEDAVAVDCREIQKRFAASLKKWEQMLCVVDRIVALQKAPCPDTYCINKLKKEAEQLKRSVEQLYPAAWDERTILLHRRWTLDSAKITKDNNAIPADNAFDLTRSNPLFAIWKNSLWTTPNNIPFTTITQDPSSLTLTQTHSVTSYCLESIGLDVVMGTIVPTEQAPSSFLKIHF
jgi:hypothetical protein